MKAWILLTIRGRRPYHSASFAFRPRTHANPGAAPDSYVNTRGRGYARTHTPSQAGGRFLCPRLHRHVGPARARAGHVDFGGPRRGARRRGDAPEDALGLGEAEEGQADEGARRAPRLRRGGGGVQAVAARQLLARGPGRPEGAARLRARPEGVGRGQEARRAPEGLPLAPRSRGREEAGEGRGDTDAGGFACGRGQARRAGEQLRLEPRLPEAGRNRPRTVDEGQPRPRRHPQPQRADTQERRGAGQEPREEVGRETEPRAVASGRSEGGRRKGLLTAAPSSFRLSTSSF